MIAEILPNENRWVIGCSNLIWENIQRLMNDRLYVAAKPIEWILSCINKCVIMSLQICSEVKEMQMIILVISFYLGYTVR